MFNLFLEPFQDIGGNLQNLLPRKVLIIDLYFRRIVCQACHLKRLLNKTNRLLIIRTRKTVLIQLYRGRDLVRGICGRPMFQRIQRRPLSVDFILDDDMIKNTIKVQYILDVCFECFTVDCVFVGLLLE
jgi:hypothetical protein